LGAGVLAVGWGLWFIVGTPPTWVNWLAVFIALFLAGYYVWRADHLRFIPRLEISRKVFIQEAETNDPSNPTIYIQIVPKCLTEAPVHGCQGHLLRVYKQLCFETDWTLTQMNSPLFLEWDYYRTAIFTIEPGIERRLNVCYWFKKGRTVIPAVEPLPVKWRSVFDSTGRFKFDIRVTAANCSPVDVSVTVSLDDCEWNKPKVTIL
jgi:hypothetical protein